MKEQVHQYVKAPSFEKLKGPKGEDMLLPTWIITLKNRPETKEIYKKARSAIPPYFAELWLTI